MKQTKTLLLAMVVGALTFAAGKASAYPLYLTSLSGAISSTADYGTSASTTSNKFVTVAVNMQRIMTVVSNQVFLDSGTNPPADARIAHDPYLFLTYLTNSAGYYHSLSGIVRVRISDIATSFESVGLGGKESDKITVEFSVEGDGPDGYFYEFRIFGAGTLKFKVDGRTGGSAMSISLKGGSEYGEYRDSDDGVSKGNFTLKGSGVPEWSGPYSVYWWND